MIKNIRHFGFYVRDLNESKQFYEMLGFKVVKEAEELWDGYTLITCKMENNGQKIELILEKNNEFFNHDLSTNCHIAFTIDNVEEIYNKLKEKYYISIPPRLSPDGSVKLCMIYDPNGLLLELVQEL